MKKVIVIGAGISGLTAAVYARRSGFEAVVLEKAGSPGGVSTNWVRKGYTFEGGVHWYFSISLILFHLQQVPPICSGAYLLPPCFL